MSGIAGIARHAPVGVTLDALGRMAAAIRHRGPDEYGLYSGSRVGLTYVGSNPRAIEGTCQPLTNEDGQIVLTSACEVFNHTELRRDLSERGHHFRTRCSAEVLVHAYEEWGVDLLHKLDGQFAFAIYDRNRETVLLARDRFGVRPLFYAQRNGDLFFGSEIKAILACGEVDAALDQRGLDEVLRLGAARPPRTPFSGIAALEPGTYATWKDGALWLRHYYELDYPEEADEPVDVIEQLDEIMLRSVGMRLRGDLPVGAFLSGGLDSSITALLSRSGSAYPLRSFSVTSSDPALDASSYQAAVGSEHTSCAVDAGTIAQSFPDVLWHTETPLLQTTPALMFRLARLTRESGVNVVVGGEGADELFLGDDVFKHAIVRRSLIDRSEQIDPLFSHLPRFRGSRIDDMYAPEFKAGLAGIDVICELRASLPARFFGWSPLNQAAYLEMTTRLSPFLLSSQSDRMTMAHGVEARFPFLDHKVFEFAAALPTGSRLRELRGKDVLQRWAQRVLPAEVNLRGKSRRSVPGGQSFFGPGTASWVGDLLTSEAIRLVGIFSGDAVDILLQRARAGAAIGNGESEMIVGVLSTQLWYSRFIESAMEVSPLASTGASVLLGDIISTASPMASVFGYSDVASAGGSALPVTDP